MLSNWKQLITRILLLLWGLQIVWLCWHFAPEAGDIARRIAHDDVGAAIHREDPMYRWAGTLAQVLPPDTTYVFLDHYEAGKEIEVRYFLAPRREIWLVPETPAPFLFYALHQDQASFLIIRGRDKPLGPGLRAASRSPAVQAVELPGPGRVYRVEPARLRWGFYD